MYPSVSVLFSEHIASVLKSYVIQRINITHSGCHLNILLWIIMAFKAESGKNLELSWCRAKIGERVVWRSSELLQKRRPLSSAVWQWLDWVVSAIWFYPSAGCVIWGGDYLYYMPVEMKFTVESSFLCLPSSWGVRGREREGSDTFLQQFFQNVFSKAAGTSENNFTKCTNCFPFDALRHYIGFISQYVVNNWSGSCGPADSICLLPQIVSVDIIG